MGCVKTQSDLNKIRIMFLDTIYQHFPCHILRGHKKHLYVTSDRLQDTPLILSYIPLGHKES